MDVDGGDVCVSAVETMPIPELFELYFYDESAIAVLETAFDLVRRSTSSMGSQEF